MPFILTMPKLSPTMEQGVITKWRKEEGDPIAEGDVLLEVATDKATVEYHALDKGFLRKIIVKAGGEASVGQAIAIGTESLADDISSYKIESAPSLSSAVEESACEATDAVVVSHPVKTGLVQEPFVAEAPLVDYVFPFPTGETKSKQSVSPYARKLAQEAHVDLSTVQGTGPGGRIVARDVPMGQKKEGLVSFDSRQVPQKVPGSFQIIPLSSMRRTIARRLQQAKTFIPHFYVSMTIDAEPLSCVHKQLKEGGVKISVNDLMIRAAALCLRQLPAVNRGFDTAAQSIIAFETIDISVAVSVPEGLITPIIRHADFKSVGQISVEMKSLAKKAQEGKLQRSEYVGGSFTISNLGMFGVDGFQGIINPPQAAILCVGGIQEVPVVKKGEVVPGKTLTLSLSADHRVIDGADAARFLQELRKILENPAWLLL